MVGFQRLARDVQHQQLLGRATSETNEASSATSRAGPLEQVLRVAMQAHPAGLEDQPGGHVGPPPLALRLGLGEPLQQQAGRRLVERRAVKRSLDERRLGRRRPSVLPDLLDPLQVLCPRRNRARRRLGERDRQEPQPVEEPADLAGPVPRYRSSDDLAGLDPVELDLEPRGRPAEVLDDRRHARLGRHVADPVRRPAASAPGPASARPRRRRSP